MKDFHMVVRDVISRADVILEVVDSRFPDETRDHSVEYDVKRANKPLIIVINKCDLVSKRFLERAKARLSKTAPTVFVSSSDRLGTKMLRKKIVEVARVAGRDILVGCVGYPNTGKSSVINAVSGRHAARTSMIAGHTRGVQLIHAGSRIMFMDTPGVIPFTDENERVQGLLSMKDATHIKDPVGVAMIIIEKFKAENPEALGSFYGVSLEGQDPYDAMMTIGRKANCIKSKGEVDETRAAVMIINDWQKGRLKV